jgi:hypothetical protein
MPLFLDLYSQPAGVDYFKFTENIHPAQGQQRRAFRQRATNPPLIEAHYCHSLTCDGIIRADEDDTMIYQSTRGLLPKLHELKDVGDLLKNIQHCAYMQIHSFPIHSKS